MKFLVLEIFKWPKKNYFKGFFGQFFGHISLNKFATKVPNSPSCSIHVFYKGKLQSLTKRRFQSG